MTDAQTWSQPQIIPMPDCPLEVSHSLRPMPSGRLLAPGATLTTDDTLGEEVFVIVSDDSGKSWPHRRTAQGIVGCLATFTPEAWTVHHESLIYDAQAHREGPHSGKTGVDELSSFQFGFPTAIRLSDGDYPVTYWSVESNATGIRWTKLRVGW